jgi:hypothetical protein
MRRELDPIDPADERLRAETDPDPLVEQGTERLRIALSSLDAKDEWGRPLAWRHVVRIAMGTVLAELRDAQTALSLAEATRRRVTEAATGWPSR